MLTQALASVAACAKCMRPRLEQSPRKTNDRKGSSFPVPGYAAECPSFPTAVIGDGKSRHSPNGWFMPEADFLKATLALPAEHRSIAHTALRPAPLAAPSL